MTHTLPVKKLLATLIIMFCLWMQLYAIAWPKGGEYWPFVDYPMFSSSHQEGDQFKVHELRAVPCHQPGAAHQVHWTAIGFHSYTYWRALREIMNDDPAGPKRRAELERAVLAAEGSHVCTLQIWERSAIVTRHGCWPRNPPWKLVRDWKVDRSLVSPG